MFVISKDLPKDMEKKLTDAFIAVGKDKEGQKLLQKLYRIDSFAPATDQDYATVKTAIKLAGIDLPNEFSKKKK